MLHRAIQKTRSYYSRMVHHLLPSTKEHHDGDYKHYNSTALAVFNATHRVAAWSTIIQCHTDSSTTVVGREGNPTKHPWKNNVRQVL